jgi:hypothetical protein
VLEHTIAALVQAITQRVEDRIWPTSAAGWIAVVVSGGLLLDRLWNRGKKEGVDESTLNGIGARVGVVETSSTSAHTRIDELVRRADAKDVEIRGVTADIARLEAKVDQTLNQGTENKLEIISEFQRIAGEVRSGFHLLDVKVEKMGAVADERERVRERLGS